MTTRNLVDDSGKSYTACTNNYVAAGGEGEIFRQGNEIIKLYHSLQQTMKLGKIQELQQIKHANVIVPRSVLFEKGNPVGVVMKAAHGVPMVSMLTKGYRKTHGINDKNAHTLVQMLHEMMQSVHDAKCLIVDMNEYNFMVNDQNWNELFAIDTDSYSTPHYPATAIMDNIRDRHRKQISRDTDYFSFAVISFMLFTAIHPFKGIHKIFKDNMEQRMKNCISVLNPEVRVPPTTLSFDGIPGTYMDWYKTIFHTTERPAPPSSMTKTHQIKAVVCQSTNRTLILDLINDAQGALVGCNANKWHRRKSQAYFINTSHGRAIIEPIKNGFNISDVDNRITEFLNAETDGYVIGQDGSMYAQFGSQLQKLVVQVIANKMVVGWTYAGTVMQYATRFFDGVMVQDIVGAKTLGIPSKNGIHNLRVSELDSTNIISAIARGNVVIVIAKKGQDLIRFVIRHDGATGYTVRPEKLDHNIDLRLAVLDRGVAITFKSDDELEIFTHKLNDQNVRVVKTDQADASWNILNVGDEVYFVDTKDKLYRGKLT